jgi:hypothetical protein
MIYSLERNAAVCALFTVALCFDRSAVERHDSGTVPYAGSERPSHLSERPGYQRLQCHV